jgi:hypothetical protein
MAYVARPTFWFSRTSAGREISRNWQYHPGKVAVLKPKGAAVMAVREARARVLEATLRQYHPRDLLTYCIVATAVPLKWHQRRFRPAAEAPYELG